ncbi:hypothetical protein HanRHA438_Chr17g0804781 [Helianthus annuus]|nr:hypothetical protein HanRHA438_Chr17g0804781 [Helianthus annuus]
MNHWAHFRVRTWYVNSQRGHWRDRFIKSPDLNKKIDSRLLDEHGVHIQRFYFLELDLNQGFRKRWETTNPHVFWLHKWSGYRLLKDLLSMLYDLEKEKKCLVS